MIFRTWKIKQPRKKSDNHGMKTRKERKHQWDKYIIVGSTQSESIPGQ